MLLQNKTAVVYGGGGSIGGAVARAFVQEGATVFLAGRTPANLDRVAKEITAAGGEAEPAEVDALDAKAIDEHANAVVKRAGRLDISLNLITHPHTHGVPLHEMDVDDFLAPVETAARTTFLTAGAAARQDDQAGVGGDPRLRRSRRAQSTVAGLLPRRNPGRPSMRSRRSGGSCQSSWDRTGSGSVTLASGGVPETFPDDFEEAEEDHGDDRGPRRCSAGPRRSRTWATPPSSPHPIGLVR